MNRDSASNLSYSNIFLLVVIFAVLFNLSCSMPNENRVSSPSSASNNTSKQLSPSNLSELPNRPTVFELVRNEPLVEVQMSIPNSTESHQFDREYKRLMDEGVLNCKYAEALSDGTPYLSNCTPGPAGSSLNNSLSMIVGYKKPSEITGIVRTSENSAVADMTLTYAADLNNSLYQKYKAIFDRIGQINGPHNLSPQAGKAFLILYDDGWRLQRTCIVGGTDCY